MGEDDSESYQAGLASMPRPQLISSREVWPAAPLPVLGPCGGAAVRVGLPPGRHGWCRKWWAERLGGTSGRLAEL